MDSHCFFVEEYIYEAFDSASVAKRIAFLIDFTTFQIAIGLNK